MCSHGECRDNRIWDFQACWNHLTTTERQSLRDRLASALRSGEDLRGLTLTKADLQEFDFTGADLSEVFFNGCNLSRSTFIEADLRRAFFGGANLEDCDMTRARLDGAVLTGANLHNIRLLAYSLRSDSPPVNLQMRLFGDQGFRRRPHINEERSYLAAATYQALKIYFLNDGDYDSASWASYCERLMQRKTLLQSGKYFSWFISLLFSAICGYGEKPIRVFSFSIAVILFYAVIYKAFNVLLLSGIPDSVGWSDALYFSAATFSGLSFPDLVPKANPLIRLLVTTESFGGIFALSLFVFTLTKRYVAR